MNEKFKQELINASVSINGNMVVNTRLLSKDASIYFFMKNYVNCFQLNYPNHYGNFFLPEHLEDIANEIFSKPKIYVAMTPCEHYFNKNGEYERETNCITCTVHKNNIIGTIENFLINDDGCSIIYIYMLFGYYYSFEKTYMLRMARVKEE